MKNLLEGLNSRTEQAKKELENLKIGQLRFEDKSTEFIQSK